jgi:hypothetical protein
MSEVDTLQTVLDGTDAAVYAYGLIAAHLGPSQEQLALSAMAAHRGERDRVRARIVALGGTPSAAAPAYVTPAPVTDPASARRLAALLEDRLAGQWAAAAAASEGPRRSSSALTAQECAVRSVTWSGVAPIWNGAT